MVRGAFCLQRKVNSIAVNLRWESNFRKTVTTVRCSMWKTVLLEETEENGAGSPDAVTFHSLVRSSTARVSIAAMWSLHKTALVRRMGVSTDKVTRYKFLST
jgi:hypothetical protein